MSMSSDIATIRLTVLTKHSYFSDHWSGFRTSAKPPRTQSFAGEKV